MLNPSAAAAAPSFPFYRHLPMIALVAVALTLISIAGAYWKSSVGPYLKTHPLAWQIGAPVSALVLLFLGKQATVYKRNQEWAAVVATQ